MADRKQQQQSPQRIQEAPKNEQEKPTEWGRNFWVTLIDPQTQAQFYACPSTGEATWDAPVGNFVLPPSAEGEWWELSDENRGGIPYYYHTKTGDTTWEKPDGFVIPLGIIQNTTLGRKLSQSTRRHSHLFSGQGQGQGQSPREAKSKSGRKVSPPSVISERTEDLSASASGSISGSAGRVRTKSERDSGKEKEREKEKDIRPPSPSPSRPRTYTHTPPKNQSLTAAVEYIASEGSASLSERERENERSQPPHTRHADSPDPRPSSPSSSRSQQQRTQYPQLHPQPHKRTGSATASAPSSPITRTIRNQSSLSQGLRSPSAYTTIPKSPKPSTPPSPSSPSHSSSHSPSHSPSRSPSRSRPDPSPSTSNSPAVLGNTHNASNNNISAPAPAFWRPRQRRNTSTGVSVNGNGDEHAADGNGGMGTGQKKPSTSIGFPVGMTKRGGSAVGMQTASRTGGPMVIGRPVLDLDATLSMSPIKRSANGVPNGRPIHVATKRLSTGDHPLLPRDLVSEIQQFAQSDFARRYFSTHREGLIFRRRVPVERMMMWQKLPLTSPLLMMNKSLHKDAVRSFKVIQRIMGDRDRDRDRSIRHTDSTSSLQTQVLAHGHAAANALLEEERWLLGEGVMHGEMRDEIYCQVIKQLNGNGNTESTFRGWQLLCVLLVTFPPSKNFEPYVRSFMLQSTSQKEGRVDIMAKYCLHRLTAISKKGPRGKAPTVAEIENASDAAFNPSTFGESLDAIYRLQERTYSDLKVPVILPFLADGILALGGTKQEGIFRVPGDADVVSELRLRIDKGTYTLSGIDDPHVLASLFKLWLRELLDPLVPQELYNACVECADEPERVVEMVGRLPTIHRRVVLFVISFLQLFLEEKVCAVTKMTSANLALVMAPNILRCGSESMSVVFTNAQYEQRFVHNLLLHLRCDQIDPDYIPEHGKGASTPGRKSHQKTRRPKP